MGSSNHASEVGFGFVLLRPASLQDFNGQQPGREIQQLINQAADEVRLYAGGEPVRVMADLTPYPMLEIIQTSVALAQVLTPGRSASKCWLERLDDVSSLREFLTRQYADVLPVVVTSDLRIRAYFHQAGLHPQPRGKVPVGRGVPLAEPHLFVSSHRDHQVQYVPLPQARLSQADQTA